MYGAAGMVFTDRRQAGEFLVEALKKYRGKDAVIFALPRGGVVVAIEIAKKLNLPIDLLIVRKIPHPLNREYAIGAICENGQVLYNEAEAGTIDKQWLKGEVGNQKEEIERRQLLYRDGKNHLPPTGKIAIIVDDGIATGLTIEVAIKELKKQEAQKVVVAVPVVPPDVAKVIESQADELIALQIPKDYLGAVGAYYAYFPQVTDEEVMKLLRPQSGI